MKNEKEVLSKVPIHQRSWFMWLWLIIFPPVGIIFLWIQKKFNTLIKVLLTIFASIYFILPIVIITLLIVMFNSPAPLYYSHEEFEEAFNLEVEKHDLKYTINNTVEDNVITSELSPNTILIENMDSSGKVQELILIGQGKGTDILINIGILIGITNPQYGEEEIGQVFEELRFFDKDYQFNSNEITVEKDRIRYNLKYDEAMGVIFSCSKIN